MKYYQITKNMFVGAFVLTVFLLSACRDELKYDVKGDTTNRVYVRTPTSYINTYNFSVIHTPVSNIGVVMAKFPARCTLEAATDLKVTFAVDNSLVSAYNNVYSTGYKQVPDSLLSIVNPVLNIPKGNFSSIDSIAMSITNQRLSYLTDPGYIVPIKITTISSTDNIAVSSNQSIVYVIIATSVTNCYNSPLIGDMVGTLITSRTAWTATLDATPSSGTLANMFDAKTTTYWYVSPSKEVNLTVNLGIAYTNITGIRIHCYSSTYYLYSLIVYTSSDGITWNSQGLATLATVSSYQYVKFYSPIATAKYIKVDVKSWKSSSNLIMAEFDVYKN